MLALVAPLPAQAAGTFVDDDGSIFENDIEWLVANEITKGCTATQFCPEKPVTRGQMAAFLSRALHLPDGTANTFTDDDGSVFEEDIARLAKSGITTGCTATEFCPDKPVTRAQMAAFLVRGLHLTDNGGGNTFVDDDGSLFEEEIARLATAQITTGCGPDRFCPNDPVRRGQMAAFLHRAAPRFPAQEFDPAVDAYLASLPTWAEFSPPEATADPHSTGEPQTVEEEVSGTKYECTTTPYSLTDTPEDIVTFNPDSNILWLGSLLQGKGYKEGIGSLAELPIRQRAPVVVSIDLLTGDTTRTVADPTVATVQQATGDLISVAESKDLPVASDVYFKQEEMQSVDQVALSLGLSAKYLGASVKATLDASRTAEEHTIAAYFVENAFTASMVLPQTPGAMFSGAFTKELLDEQEALGRIGPDNLPVFVDSVTYGRVLMFSFTSKATTSDIKGTLNAVYNGGKFGASADLSVEQKKILSEATIKVVTVGGTSSNALALIKSGDLGSYFSETAALSSFRPISYTVRNLGDSSLAKVSDTLSYNIKTCTAKPPTPPTGYDVKVTFDQATLLWVDDGPSDFDVELIRFYLNVRARDRKSAADPGTNPLPADWNSIKDWQGPKTDVDEEGVWAPAESGKGMWYMTVPYDNTGQTGAWTYDTLQLSTGFLDYDASSGDDWTEGKSSELTGATIDTLLNGAQSAPYTFEIGNQYARWQVKVTIAKTEIPAS